MEYSKKYDDIINLPRHVSKNHPQMSLYARSAQFAPFAALTGYDGMIQETSRFINQKIEIDEELKVILDSKLQIIQEKIKIQPEITFTYFIPDLKKEGGSYIIKTGRVKKIDIYNQVIYLLDDTEIPINEIIDITGDIIKSFD